MAAVEAVNLLIEDHGDKSPASGFRKEFAEDVPYRSFPQRRNKSLDELLKVFGWDEDDASWMSENSNKAKDSERLARFRKRVEFCICGWRELNEDFGRGDVSCLRDIRTPLVTSRSPLRAMRDEFSEAGDTGK